MRLATMFGPWVSKLVLPLVIAVVASTLPVVVQAQSRLVNMIPQSRSGETNQDSEPTLTVDPNDYTRMVGTAFTWDNLTGSAMTTATAPVYVSTDGGTTWTLAFIVPSAVGAGFPTGDITLSFSATLGGGAHTTGWLYGGILSAATAGFPMTVLRTQDAYGPALMAVIDTHATNVDQPHTHSLTALGGSGSGTDKLYVGFNNGFGNSPCPPTVAPNGRSSTVDLTQSGTVASPSFSLAAIDSRNSNCQDGFAQVPAPHPDGTVYTAFFHNWASSGNTPELVVVRDDAWGTGTPPFGALLDSTDHNPGQVVEASLTMPLGTMGQTRLGASNLGIAVDPRNSDRVYVVWGDNGGSNTETIHVRRSIDRGQTWPGPDLLTVTNALNPEIAISALGTVGVLYQQLVSNRWQVHLVRTTDTDDTTFDTPGVLLANTDATTPSSTFQPYLGDYSSLVSAGKNFFGIFSANNTPNTANFLSGVVYQRYVDWTTNTLYADAAHTTVVSPSIDPFFFEVDAVALNAEFYVRDWTSDPSHGDNGVEPSTDPVFYATSDVWNGRSTTPAPFVNDQPVNADAGNGAGAVGDNWAFARVRRNAPGSATAVTAHFLVSKFGTGSNFVDSTTMDPDVTFPDPDPVVSADTTAGPWISPPYHWHLNAIAGNHLCLAVQITAPGDPYIPPTLAGNTPGWATGTDLRIISDNHKAQRNMQLSTVAAGGGASGHAYGIVHNGGLVARDIPLRIGTAGNSKRYVRINVTEIGAQKPVTSFLGSTGTGGTLVLHAVQPGENRWVDVDVQTIGLPAGDSAFVTVDELAGNAVASGFGIGFTGQPIARAIYDSLVERRMVATRLSAGFHATRSALDVVPARLSPADYVDFVHAKLIPHLNTDLTTIGASGAPDAFGITPKLHAAAAQNAPASLIVDVTTLLDAVDSYLTQRQLAKGDPADIVQMVRWQKQLFRQNPRLARLACAKGTVALSNAFVLLREYGKLTNAAYPQLLRDTAPCLRQALGSAPFAPGTTDLASLERQHHDDLLVLAR